MPVSGIVRRPRAIMVTIGSRSSQCEREIRYAVSSAAAWAHATHGHDRKLVPKSASRIRSVDSWPYNESGPTRQSRDISRRMKILSHRHASIGWRAVGGTIRQDAAHLRELTRPSRMDTNSDVARGSSHADMRFRSESSACRGIRSRRRLAPKALIRPESRSAG